VRASSRWRGGFAALLEGAAAALPGSADLRLGRRVSSLAWGPDGGGTAGAGSVRLTHEGPEGDSETLEADHAVVTASLGVLKEVVDGGGGLSLQPALPETKASAIRRLGFGTVDKVLLRYEAPWWEGLWGRLHVLWDDPPGGGAPEPAWVRGVYSLSPEPGGLGLECWLSGHSAREMEAAGEEEVAAALHALAVRCAGPLPAEAPRPSGLLRSAWGSHHGFRGSYSYVPTGASGTDIDELARPEGGRARLVLAGEHTHRTYYSYAHGAWLSGVRAAEAVLAHYQA